MPPKKSKPKPKKRKMEELEESEEWDESGLKRKVVAVKKENEEAPESHNFGRWAFAIQRVTYAN